MNLESELWSLAAQKHTNYYSWAAKFFIRKFDLWNEQNLQKH